MKTKFERYVVTSGQCRVCQKKIIQNCLTDISGYKHATRWLGQMRFESCICSSVWSTNTFLCLLITMRLILVTDIYIFMSQHLKRIGCKVFDAQSLEQLIEVE